jgi:hypothetical protein
MDRSSARKRVQHGSSDRASTLESYPALVEYGAAAGTAGIEAEDEGRGSSANKAGEDEMCGRLWEPSRSALAHSSPCNAADTTHELSILPTPSFQPYRLPNSTTRPPPQSAARLTSYAQAVSAYPYDPVTLQSSSVGAKSRGEGAAAGRDHESKLVVNRSNRVQ